MWTYKSKYFTLQELCRSTTADKLKIKNVPNESQELNLMMLTRFVLDPARTIWGSPIYVNSGFRCERLNEVVGGAKNSGHLYGRAADITTKRNDLNWALYTLIKNSDIPFEKMIFEEKNGSTWIHISYVATNMGGKRLCYKYNFKDKVYIKD